VTIRGANPKAREVLPGVVLLPLPLPMRPTIVNVYLVDGGSEWALVDTGMATAESMQAFRTALAELGIEATRIRKIVCTHHHPDHFGTSARYRELCQAEVFLHPLEVERVGFFLPKPRSQQTIDFFLRNGIPRSLFANLPSPGEFWRGLYEPTRPDHLLADGDRITVGDRTLEVVWTPGHSPGHCVIVLPAEKVAIVGDHLLPKITPHVGITSDGPQDPLGDFIASLKKVGELDVDTVLPAHGGVYHDARRRATQLVEFHEYRMQVMLDVVRGRPRSAYEVALESFGLDADSPFQQQFPATFESLAHLEHMRRQGRVRRQERDGTTVWAARPAR
jgi:glyoxylase-like metal-dependent hydrolase (beta-lactamase superfamily II)